MRRVFRSLAFRLSAALAVAVTAVLGLSGAISYRLQRAEVEELTRSYARRGSDLVRGATYYGMVLDHREVVGTTIDRLAGAPDVAAIHVYDNQGVVRFSSDRDTVGRRVQPTEYPCQGCHQSEGQIRDTLLPSHRFQRQEHPRHGPVLSAATAIRNEPACWSAACHAHPKERTVLGIVEVLLSLKPAEAAIATRRTDLLWTALASLLAVAFVTTGLVLRMVRRPLRELQAVAGRVGGGELGARAVVGSTEELLQLSLAFNRMTAELEAARAELTDWSESLERKVEEKTEQLGRMQQQVLHMEKMASLGKLSATVAHELNNPLAGMLNYARLTGRVLDGQELPDDVRGRLGSYLGLIQKETARCGAIVRNLLLFARPTGAELSEVHLNELIERSVMLVQHRCEIENVTLSQVLVDGDDTLIGDAGQLEQALVALLVNAVEAMASQKRRSLSVSASANAREVIVAIADTGPGIPEEHRARVFEPFYSTKGQEAPGVGLGLSVVFGIVKRHGGRIELESKPGEGTLFVIRLPRRPPAEPTGGENE